LQQFVQLFARSGVGAEDGLDLLFHPHVATSVETTCETADLFDAVSSTKMGLPV
jgi:hypothetical protein